MIRLLPILLMILVVAHLGAELVINEAWSYTDNPNGTNPGESSANSTLSLPGGDILTVGYTSSTYNDTYVEYPTVVRHSPNGSIVWGNTYHLSEFIDGRTRAIYAGLRSDGSVFIGSTTQGTGMGGHFMVINPNNGDVSVHSAFYYTPLGFKVLPTAEVFFVYDNKGSGSGAFAEIRLYDFTSTQVGASIEVSAVGLATQVKSLEICADGGYLMAGSRGNDGLLVRFNSSMGVIWEQTYTGAGTGTQVLNYAYQTPDGSILAAGKNDGDGFAFRATYTGTLLWQQLPGGIEFNHILELEDGNCLVSGAYGVPFNGRNYIVIYSETGEYVYSHLHTDHYGWYRQAAKVGTDDFVVVGWRNDHGGTSQSDFTINYFHSYVDNPIVVTEVLPFEPTPMNNSVSVMASTSQAFSITAYDPDNNPLNYSWILGSELVSTQSTYTFASELAQAGESYLLFLSVNDNSRSSIMYQWTINVTPYINPPYAPYPNYPYDNATYVPVDYSPSLSWSYAWDESHSQDSSILYLSTDYQQVATLNNAAKAQDDGTLHYDYSFDMVPGQTYYWRVIALNGAQQTIGDIWTFSTESVITDFPYVQDFEGGFLPPAGWANKVSSALTQAPQNGMGGGWSNAWDSQYIHAGDGALMCTPYQMPQYYWVLSPLMRIDSSTVLNFWVNYQSSAENPTELYVMINTVLGWQELYSFNSIAESNAYASQMSLPLGAYYGQNARLAFVYKADSSANIVAIDDVSVTANAAIPTVQNLQIQKIGSTVELSWDSASAEELFRVYSASDPQGPWTLVSGASGFSRIGTRSYWSTAIASSAFYQVRRYIP